jgi:Phage integrase family
VLSDDEIGEVWRAAGKAASPYGTIIRLLILTGQRLGEVAGMNWNEISDDLATWVLPGERTKNGMPHVLPLSPPVRNLLKDLLPESAAQAKRAVQDLRATGALVLPGVAATPFSGWSKSKAKLFALLRAGTERPTNGCAADKNDELPPPHSITSSARPSKESGTVRPSAPAVSKMTGIVAVAALAASTAGTVVAAITATRR